jgi:hypothetical protein
LILLACDAGLLVISAACEPNDHDHALRQATSGHRPPGAGWDGHRLGYAHCESLRCVAPFDDTCRSDRRRFAERSPPRAERATDPGRPPRAVARSHRREHRRGRWPPLRLRRWIRRLRGIIQVGGDRRRGRAPRHPPGPRRSLARPSSPAMLVVELGGWPPGRRRSPARPSSPACSWSSSSSAAGHQACSWSSLSSAAGHQVGGDRRRGPCG